MLSFTKIKRDKWADELKMFAKPLPGRAEELISYNQPGRASFKASHWPAKLYENNRRIVLEPGQSLLVVGQENLTLLVVPAGS